MKTLEREVFLSGVGVHSGQITQLKLKPSDTGRVEFIRTDLENRTFTLDPRKIEANYSTAFKDSEWKIQTLEHLMAVLAVFGIDSLIVELDGDEIPIMDGSAKPIVEALLGGGIRELPGDKEGARIIKSFCIQDGDASVSVAPDPDFRITCIIEFEHPAIGRQEISLLINQDSFIEHIAPARTFGFLKDVPALRSKGLAMGGSLENAVVLDDKGVINGPLRFPDEFVRHKVLDFIGDLSLFNSRITGHFEVCRAGHRLHHQLVLFLLDHPEYWTRI